ncbi:hypothetical protein D1871_23095 [Nakamurella silvestris]|nr:hypothetical protein D1871_23095 [Nakamurella silvestris]
MLNQAFFTDIFINESGVNSADHFDILSDVETIAWSITNSTVDANEKSPDLAIGDFPSNRDRPT